MLERATRLTVYWSDFGAGRALRGINERISEIVARRLPKGYRLVEHRDPHGGGEATDSPRVIRCPPLLNRYALGVFFHEVAHVVLGHLGNIGLSSWREEYEAEIWAMAALRGEGFAVPVGYLASAQDNVRCHVEKALAKDPDAEIDEEVLRFAFPDEWRDAV